MYPCFALTEYTASSAAHRLCYVCCVQSLVFPAACITWLGGSPWNRGRNTCAVTSRPFKAAAPHNAQSLIGSPPIRIASYPNRPSQSGPGLSRRSSPDQTAAAAGKPSATRMQARRLPAAAAIGCLPRCQCSYFTNRQQKCWSVFPDDPSTYGMRGEGRLGPRTEVKKERPSASARASGRRSARPCAAGRRKLGSWPASRVSASHQL